MVESGIHGTFAGEPSAALASIRMPWGVMDGNRVPQEGCSKNAGPVGAGLEITCGDSSYGINSWGPEEVDDLNVVRVGVFWTRNGRNFGYYSVL